MVEWDGVMTPTGVTAMKRILRSRTMLILEVYFNEDAALSLLARPRLNYEENWILNTEYWIDCSCG